jgi:hypothetical protein
MVVQAILGLRADAPARRLYVLPTLPDWLPEIQLRRLKVGDSLLHLRFWRERERSRWEVVDRRGCVEVAEGPGP